MAPIIIIIVKVIIKSRELRDYQQYDSYYQYYVCDSQQPGQLMLLVLFSECTFQIQIESVYKKQAQEEYHKIAYSYNYTACDRRVAPEGIGKAVREKQQRRADLHAGKGFSKRKGYGFREKYHYRKCSTVSAQKQHKIKLTFSKEFHIIPPLRKAYRC